MRAHPRARASATTTTAAAAAAKTSSSPHRTVPRRPRSRDVDGDVATSRTRARCVERDRTVRAPTSRATSRATTTTTTTSMRASFLSVKRCALTPVHDDDDDVVRHRHRRGVDVERAPTARGDRRPRAPRRTTRTTTAARGRCAASRCSTASHHAVARTHAGRARVAHRRHGRLAMGAICAV